MLVPLEFPPGLYRQGTEYQAEGRFYDANLWRWSNGKSGPKGGWAALGAGVSGTVRGIHSWLDINAVGRLALASRAKIWALSVAGVASDITPDGMSERSATSQWSIDNAGQRLFAVNDDEGIIRTWLPGEVQAVTLTNAPTAAALVVTQESILMAFGAAGDPRLIQWCDVDAYTVWAPNTTNYAGDFPLQSRGKIMGARKIRGGVLVLTDEDAHLGRYLDQPLVYGFTQIGADCGVISRNGMAIVDDQAFWMGKNGFYASSGGGVAPLPCPVHDDVFGSAEEPARGINRAASHCVYAVHVAEHNEIWWLYPQGASIENNRAVVYNYAENHWALDQIVRTCGTGRGNGFNNPVMIGAEGAVWEHEKGIARPGAGTIFARSGPMELGAGEAVMYGDSLIPDEADPGDVETYIRTRIYPNATETVSGPFQSASPMGCRFSGRQASIEHRLKADAGKGTVGTYRVKVRAGGTR